jgi:elongation factor 1-alpha
VFGTRSAWIADIRIKKMLAECDTGDTEYKRHLVVENDQDRKVKTLHVATQMQYRLSEGHGRAFYWLGVDDDGTSVGMTTDEQRLTLDVIRTAAASIDAVFTVISNTCRPGTKRSVIHGVVRESSSTATVHIHTRVVVVGHVNSGKSTLLSILVYGGYDDGRGCARNRVATHVHELVSGRTSTMAQHLIGYDSDGLVVNQVTKGPIDRTWRTVVSRSHSLLTLIDLPGHQKYLSTVLRGIRTHRPNACIVVVSGVEGIELMTAEHLVATAKYNVIFVVTKSQLATKTQLKRALKDVRDLVKRSMHMITHVIRTGTDVSIAIKHQSSLVPVFVTDNTIEHCSRRKHLHEYLSMIEDDTRASLGVTPPVLVVSSVFNTVKGVGLVVGGHLSGGDIVENDKLLLGPIRGVGFIPVRVRSIHVDRCPVERGTPGSYVCVSLTNVPRDVTVERDAVLLSLTDTARHRTTQTFEATITIPLQVTTSTLTVGSTTIIHVTGGQRIVARILNLGHVVDDDKKHVVALVPGLTRACVVLSVIASGSVTCWIDPLTLPTDITCSDGGVRGHGTIDALLS